MIKERILNTREGQPDSKALKLHQHQCVTQQLFQLIKGLQFDMNIRWTGEIDAKAKREVPRTGGSYFITSQHATFDLSLLFIYLIMFFVFLNRQTQREMRCYGPVRIVPSVEERDKFQCDFFFLFSIYVFLFKY